MNRLLRNSESRRTRSIKALGDDQLPKCRLSPTPVVSATARSRFFPQIFPDRVCDSADVAGRTAWVPADTARRHQAVCRESMVALPSISRSQVKRMEGDTQLGKLLATAHAAGCTNEPKKRVGTERQA
jgi:hypothetical protein